MRLKISQANHHWPRDVTRSLCH